VPTEQAAQVISCLPPNECEHCTTPLIPKNKITRHQIYEIPLPRYDIIEYQIRHAFCSCCKKTYRGKLLSSIGKRGFGTWVHAVTSLLTSKFRLSKRQALALLKDFYDIPICVGTVSNIEHRVSNTIEVGHAEIEEKLASSKVVHIDETEFKQKNRNGWAWTVASKEYSFFKLDISRGKKVARQLIGDFNGRTIVSDRYPAYGYLPERCHQVCWSHLKRDFRKISERGNISGVIGRNLLRHYGRIFGFWKASLIKGFIDDRRSRKKRSYLKRALLKELQRGCECSHGMAPRMCRKIFDQGESLFLFLSDKDIPATNNLAERQLRPLVIAKKLSFGVQSERGARFIERIFNITTSFRQQQQNPLTWLQGSINNYFCGQPIPSIA
jgi:transposase